MSIGLYFARRSSQNKLTPLHAAAMHGHAEVAKVLLAAGANVHDTDDVSEEGWEQGLQRRGPLHEGWGGIKEAGGSHVPSTIFKKHTHPLACSRAEWLLLLAGK